MFNTLLPGKTLLEATKIANGHGYKIYCALNDGVQRPNTWGNEKGGIYVEIRGGLIYKILRMPM
jgi:hypothetical protein